MYSVLEHYNKYFVYNNIEKYENFNDKISLLNLILYDCKSEYENIMKTNLTEYLLTTNVTFYFIAMRSQEEDIIEKDNCIYFNGIDTLCSKSSLYKTIMAINYCISKGVQFDYLVRSNISTAINFSLLKIYLY
jgi:hypothetical protein